MNEQTKPAAPFLAPALVVVAGTAYAVGAFPIGDAVRAAWDTYAPLVATWIGA